MKVYNCPKDLEYPYEVNKVAYLEGYQGYVVVTMGDVVPTQEIDLASIVGGSSVVFNSSQNIFLVNCSHGLFRQVYKRGINIESSFPLKDGDHRRMDDSIQQYFSGEFSGPTPPPQPQPAPEFTPEVGWQVPEEEPFTDDTEEGWHDGPYTDLVDDEE